MTNYNNQNNSSSSHAAWDKITQTHELFKKIIAPLKEHLNINFGYMIVFNDGSYYQIIEDLECLKKWVTSVETSHIFCGRNVTTYFDEPYNFTIWPEESTCPAMEIYKEYDMWNGITVSKQSKDYTELYWFTKQNAEFGWHKWFVRNKPFFIQFIELFSSYKSRLRINNYSFLEMFSFSNNFNTKLPNSEYLEIERNCINQSYNALFLDFLLINNKKIKSSLSFREKEVLSMLCCGYPYKSIAKTLDISERTIKFHVKQIKYKSGINSKAEIIHFFKINLFKNFTN